MKFERMPGIEGLVYVPQEQPTDRKKHPCRDCFQCQMCSDNRCALCLGERPPGDAASGDDEGPG